MRSSEKFIKSNNHIPGLAIKDAQIQVNREKRQRDSLTETRDTTNRKCVRNKILEYLKDGLTKEKIAEKMVNDPIMKEFEYLTTRGIKIEVFVNNWIEDAIKKANSKDEKIR